MARDAFDEGDYRWTLEVCKHLVFADETDTAARELQADAFQQLAYGAENGTWRNAFLGGAKELRDGSFGTPTSAKAGDVVGALTVDQLLDSVAIRIDGPWAWDEHLTINWVITDTGDVHLAELRNGASTTEPSTLPCLAPPP